MTNFNLGNPLIAGFSQLKFQNHDNFLDELYATIDRACMKIAASSKKISRRENLSEIYEIIKKLDVNDQKVLKSFIEKTLEDDISLRIVDIITEDFRFRASHDHYHNGHVDIHVQSSDLQHIWLGEAKIYSGNKYNQQGLSQLVHDYSKGGKNESGGILIYVDSTSLTIESIIDSWKTRLTTLSMDPENKLTGLVTELDPTDNCILHTKHNHHLSGRTYRIKHFCVDLRSN
ncbi:hypothetical protein [Acinetobacter courvalinii]|uniref:hypothetical protein n=1 Tax=Acinetobacter courvalinii TaxID=280147 RepID=UPI00289F178D|nr:hypothetical protein [Acinetobacter courvalinii]